MRDVPQVIQTLAVREKSGYEPVWLPLYVNGPPDAPPVLFVERALTYIAPPANPHCLGFDTHHAIAVCVRKSVGPSGTNLEYIANLRDALERLGHPDPHLTAIVDIATAPQRQ